MIQCPECKQKNAFDLVLGTCDECKYEANDETLYKLRYNNNIVALVSHEEETVIYTDSDTYLCCDRLQTSLTDSYCKYCHETEALPTFSEAMHLYVGDKEFSSILFNALQEGKLYAGINDIDGTSIYEAEDDYYLDMFGFDPTYDFYQTEEYVTCTGCEYFLEGSCFSLRAWMINCFNENYKQINKIERCALYKEKE